jgi:hypothetical protein
MVGLFFFSRLQLHTAQHFIEIFPIRNILGELIVKLFGMLFMFDVSQFVNDDCGEREFDGGAFPFSGIVVHHCG